MNKMDLTFKDKHTGRVIDINQRGGGGMSGGRGGGMAGSGGRTAYGGGDWASGGRTPAMSGSERTPAWGSSNSMSTTALHLFMPLLT